LNNLNSLFFLWTGSVIDQIGSRISIIINAVVFVIGALVLAMSSNYTTLLVGRFVVGFAVALSAVSECIYISEIATPKNRVSDK
jgi:predicted MFS family arabinose efflux permease